MLSCIGKHLTTCTSQLVEFWERVIEFWTVSYIIFINKGPNNYLKVTNVNRNEPRGSIATQSESEKSYRSLYSEEKILYSVYY